MAIDSENNEHAGKRNAENPDSDRTEQFNELSELSLEARIAVADRIGIPVRDAGEAAALGTAGGYAAGESKGPAEEEMPGDETDR